jgi:hypothetical protein
MDHSFRGVSSLLLRLFLWLGCCCLCAAGSNPISSNGTLKLAIVTAQINKASGLIRRNDELLSIIMAIEAINNKTDGFYDDLLPNTTIVYEFYDSEEDTATVASHGVKFSTSKSMDECDRKTKAFKGTGVDVVIGCPTSRTSQVLQEVIKHFEIPQISGSATSSYLSKKTDYPTFSRTVFMDDQVTRAMVSFMKYEVGWDGAVLITGSDAYSLSGADLIKKFAREFEFTILGEEKFPTGTLSMDTEIKRAVDTRAKVFVYFGPFSMIPLLLETLFEMLISRGNLDEGFSIVFSDELGTPGKVHELENGFLLRNYTSSKSTKTTKQILRTMLSGSFAIVPSHRGRYFDFQQELIKHTIINNGECFGKPVSSNGCDCMREFINPKSGKPIFHVPRGNMTYCSAMNNASTVGTFAKFFFDAVLLVSHTVHDMVYNQGETKIKGAAFMRTIQHISFDGASGNNATFDEYGDRREPETVDKQSDVFHFLIPKMSQQDDSRLDAYFAYTGTIEGDNMRVTKCTKPHANGAACHSGRYSFNTQNNQKPVNPSTRLQFDFFARVPRNFSRLNVTMRLEKELSFLNDLVEVSVDGGKRWATPLAKSRRSVVVELPAPLHSYRPLVTVRFGNRVMDGQRPRHKIALECKTNSGYLSTEGPMEQWGCKRCPEGAFCGEGVTWENVQALYGWWRNKDWTESDHSNFTKCLFPASCLGARNPTLDQVFPDASTDHEEGCNEALGYEESCEGTRCRLCATCTQGFRRRSFGGSFECNKCPSMAMNRVLLGCGTLVYVLVLYIMIGRRTQKGGQRSLVSTQKTVVVNYFQVTYIIAGMNVSWPGVLAALFEVEGSVTMGEQLLNPGCEMQDAKAADLFYLRQIAYACLVPFLIVLVTLLWYVKAYAVGMRTSEHFASRGFDQKEKSYSDRLIATIVFVLYLLYPTLCRQAFAGLNCRIIDQTYYLEADLEEACWEGRHLTYFYCCTVPQCILYVLGLPLLGLFKVRQRLAGKKNQKQSTTLFRYGILYSAYNERCWYWGAVTAYRKALIVGLTGAVDNPSVEVHWINLILLVSIMANLVWEPHIGVRDLKKHEAKALHLFDSASLSVLFLTSWSGTFFGRNTECKEWCLVIFVVVFVVNFLFFFVCLYFVRGYARIFWRGLLKSFRRRKGKRSVATKFWEKSAAEIDDDLCSTEELERFRYHFNVFDTSQDNLIDFNELKALVKNMGLTLSDANLRRMMDAVDDDNSGTLSLNEFIHLASVDSPLDIEKSPEIEAVRLKIWNEVTKGIPGSSRSAPAATTTYEAVMEITI